MASGTSSGTGRKSRLSMYTLIQDGILTPGEKVLTFDYMGKHCEADLLPDGLIQWEGSKYSSPYAWASQCKNNVNPDHKSGIGWGHIRYRGIKLSQYKSIYMKKNQLSTDQQDSGVGLMDHKPPVKRGRRRKKLLSGEQEHTSFATVPSSASITDPNAALQLQHNIQPPKGTTFASPDTLIVHQQPTEAHTASSYAVVPQQPVAVPMTTSNLLLQCTSFETLGLQQPFSITVSSNALMIMDFHSHLSTGEITGYLGGTYDNKEKNLEVLMAFPCRCDVSGGEKGAEIEKEIQSSMSSRGLRVVGWYHSHPISEPKPSQHDILSQKRYQDSVRTETGEEPCMAFIVSPNHGGALSEEVSAFEAFWVLMIQQNGLQASPMQLKYSISWEQYLTQEVVDEMNELARYYKPRQDCPQFKGNWKPGTLFINKLRKSLAEVQPKFPQENSDQTFMTYIDQLLLSVTHPIHQRQLSI